MQIIQSIKDRGGVIMVIFIAIALISFILMDSKSGSGKGSLTAAAVGKVNSNSIDKKEFDDKIKIEENKQAQQTGQAPTGVAVMKIREQVWNQLVAENVFYEQADKLGITLTPKEWSYILMSEDQTNPFKQERELLDGAGRLDIAKATQRLLDVKKAKGENRDYVDSKYVEPVKLGTAVAKYSGLINASAYYPTWMKEKDATERKNFATISYVAVPYSEISDSTITVKDEEINAYVAKRKDMFKQEAGRTVSYLSFSQLPSAADSVLAKKQVEDLKAGFIADTSAKAYVARNTSAFEYKDEYLPVSRLTSTQKDTITKQAVGAVFGPYIDGDNYSLSKIVGVKQLPDSIKARHILIGTRDPKTGDVTKVDSVAKKLADSILVAIKGGANFEALALQYSTDEGSKIKGGDVGTFGYGKMVTEFYDYCYTNAVGDKKVVQTQFGYHVIDITSQTNFKPAYKIARVAKPILATDETFNAATQAATKAAVNKDSKSFTDYAAKNGLKIIDLPTTIKENDFAVGNMQDARTLVRWVFEAKKGDVSDPITIGEDLVVATVNKVYAEGAQDAATARPMAEAAIRNQKKADIIVAKLATATTLETAATLYNKQVMMAGADTSITLGGKIINGIGAEPKIIGAAFNAALQAKASSPIVGTSGVYIIKVNAILPKVEQTAEQVAAQTAARIGALRQQNQVNIWFEALRKQANIKDTRSKYF